ncbi:hypothetical protein [Sessilibacter corallicola]
MHKIFCRDFGISIPTFFIDIKNIKGYESNTSRIARICWKYQIPPTIFFNHYLKMGKPVTRSFFKFEVATHLNSYTDKTLEYQREINKLVGEPGNRCFSYSYLHSVLDSQARGFMSVTKRWCPVCYLERFDKRAFENGTYDDLYWSVDAIRHCLLHGVELQKKCPRCFSTQPYISTSVEPGYCHHCLHFLGGRDAPCISFEEMDNLNEVFTLFYLDTYEGVKPSFESLKENLKALKRAYPEATSRYLGDLMGTSEDVVRRWLSGKKKPQISSIYLLYKVLGLYGPHQLFYPTDIFISKVILSKALSLKFNTRSEFAGMVKAKSIIDSFESMLSGLQPTVSRADFARMHEVTEGFLMSSYSGYCERLSIAHQARLTDLRANKKKDLVEQFAVALGKVRSRKKQWTIDNTIQYLEDPSLVDGFSSSELYIPFSKAKKRLREMDILRKQKEKDRKWQV